MLNEGNNRWVFGTKMSYFISGNLYEVFSSC